MIRPRRPEPRFARGDIVRLLRQVGHDGRRYQPPAGTSLRVWWRFEHRLRMPDGSLQYVYDIRPLSVRPGDLDAALGSVAAVETDLER